MPDNSFSQLLQRKSTVLIVFALALILLAYTSFGFYSRYQEIMQLKADVNTARQPVARKMPANTGVKNTQQLTRLYLFGKKQKQAAPVPQVIDAPVTRLKLTLIGVVAADEADQSKAIIQIDNKQVAIFAVGDQLPKTNAMVHQILPTQILLMRNGKLEKLAINRPDLEEEMAKSADGRAIINTGGSEKILMLPERPQRISGPPPVSARNRAPSSRSKQVNRKPPANFPPIDLRALIPPEAKEKMAAPSKPEKK